MAEINSSSFGSITIDSKTYRHDVYVLPSGRVVEREYGHTFTKDQIEYVLKEKPDIIVIGKGTSGMAGLSRDAKALLEKKRIEIIEARTPEMVDKFNKFAKTNRVAAIIHVTC